MARTRRIDLLKSQLEFLKSHKASSEEIEEVEQQIKRSKKGSYRKQKGGVYEREVIAKRFNEFYKDDELDLRRTPGSGGWGKSAKSSKTGVDLCNINDELDFRLAIECKDCKTIKIIDWTKQVESNCGERFPTLAFHRQQQIKNGKVVTTAGDYICLRLDDFLTLVNKDKIIVRKEGAKCLRKQSVSVAKKKLRLKPKMERQSARIVKKSGK
jgi:hypothetical protein